MKNFEKQYFWLFGEAAKRNRRFNGRVIYEGFSKLPQNNLIDDTCDGPAHAHRGATLGEPPPPPTQNQKYSAEKYPVRYIPKSNRKLNLFGEIDSVGFILETRYFYLNDKIYFTWQ